MFRFKLFEVTFALFKEYGIVVPWTKHKTIETSLKLWPKIYVLLQHALTMIKKKKKTKKNNFEEK